MKDCDVMTGSVREEMLSLLLAATRVTKDYKTHSQHQQGIRDNGCFPAKRYKLIASERAEMAEAAVNKARSKAKDV